MPLELRQEESKVGEAVLRAPVFRLFRVLYNILHI